MDHATAHDFEQALQPLLDGVPAGGALIVDLSARRLHQQRRPARVDGGRASSCASSQAHVVVAALRRRGRGDLRHQPLRSHPRCARSTTRWSSRRALAASLQRELRGRDRHEARALLGHARLAAGRADGSDGLRQKLRAALRAARGRPLATRRRRRTLARQPALRRRAAPTAATAPACRSKPAGRDYFVCDMGSGLRAFGQAAMAQRTAGVAADLPHLHVPPALGPHHGAAVLRAGLHSRQPRAHLRQPRASWKPRCAGSRSRRRSRSTSRSSAPSWSSCTWQPGRPPRHRRHGGHDACCSDTAAIRTATASRPHGQDGGVLHRLRAPAGRPEHTAALRRLLPRRRPGDLRRACIRWPTPCPSRRTGAIRATSSVSSCASCAGARHLCLFHHEPVSDDAAIEALLAETRRLEEITRDGDAAAGQRGLRRDGNRAVTARAVLAHLRPGVRRIRLAGAALLGAPPCC